MLFDFTLLTEMSKKLNTIKLALSFFYFTLDIYASCALFTP